PKRCGGASRWTSTTSRTGRYGWISRSSPLRRSSALCIATPSETRVSPHAPRSPGERGPRGDNTFIVHPNVQACATSRDDAIEPPESGGLFEVANAKPAACAAGQRDLE